MSHWVKVALEDITSTMLKHRIERKRGDQLERCMEESDYPRMAMLTGTMATGTELRERMEWAMVCHATLSTGS